MHKVGLTIEQKQRLDLVDELCGAFSACQTGDWRKKRTFCLRNIADNLKVFLLYHHP